MKIAIMQPYIFPYLGYFQMVNAVDIFVFYDDVNFIKQGWINRNRVLVSKKDFLFTIPLQKQNSFVLIKDTLINKNLYNNWRTKFIQTLFQNYKRAPFFEEIFELINNVLNVDNDSIGDLAIHSIQEVSSYLGVGTRFRTSSTAYKNKGLERQERLIDICKEEKADHYINALGGQELYKKEDFLKEGIKLDFIKSLRTEYRQYDNDFVPWLSIIDVLMFNSKDGIKQMLNNYELI